MTSDAALFDDLEARLRAVAEPVQQPTSGERYTTHEVVAEVHVGKSYLSRLAKAGKVPAGRLEHRQLRTWSAAEVEAIRAYMNRPQRGIGRGPAARHEVAVLRRLAARLEAYESPEAVAALLAAFIGEPLDPLDVEKELRPPRVLQRVPREKRAELAELIERKIKFHREAK